MDQVIKAERQTATCRLVVGRQGNHWVVDHCPFCQKQHWHGGGALNGDPRELLGGRASHCAGKVETGEYVLVEVAG